MKARSIRDEAIRVRLEHIAQAILRGEGKPDVLARFKMSEADYRAAGGAL